MTEQDRTLEADKHATAIITAMLNAEDTGDASDLHAALEAASKSVPASVAVSALASHAATAVRLLATGQDVPWQQVVERVGTAAQVLRGAGGPGDQGKEKR